mgnify:CR=1 FL=1
MRGRRQKINIVVQEPGKKPEPTEAEGLVVGIYAVTRWYKEDLTFHETKWTVTHVPTGRSIVSKHSKAQATRIRNEMHRCFPTLGADLEFADNLDSKSCDFQTSSAFVRQLLDPDALTRSLAEVGS